MLLLSIIAVGVGVVSAFRPPALVGRSNRIGPGSLPGNNKQSLFSTLPLKFSDKDDDQDGLIVQNNPGDSSQMSNENKVDALLALLDSVPSNLPTQRSLTSKILDAVKKLEATCPTDEDLVLSELSGNWELLWTAQDPSSEQFRILNPLENQSYSNNPFRGNNSWLFGDDGSDVGGRANPVLPREIQDVLERTGILEAAGGTKVAPIRSSQGIDLRRKKVRNIVNVTFKRPFPVKGSIIVDLDFKPYPQDKRRVDVTFDSCRLVLQTIRLDQTFPLGLFRVKGWLRTVYVDDRIRITRGHKGSVFILSRTAKRRSV